MHKISEKMRRKKFETKLKLRMCRINKTHAKSQQNNKYFHVWFVTSKYVSLLSDLVQSKLYSFSIIFTKILLASSNLYTKNVTAHAHCVMVSWLLKPYGIDIEKLPHTNDNNKRLIIL
uniref:Uncharacterized protein n=1 Tax=Bactrocera dorsalis TaxID=27457 RepID=A0A034VLS6_BACDO